MAGHREFGRVSEAAAYGRFQWRLTAIETCPGSPVEAAASDASGKLNNVMLLMFRSSWTSTASSPAQPAGGRRASAWLDGLDFFAAAKTCETVGAVAVHGRTPNLKPLTDAKWREAGNVGFGIAVGEARRRMAAPLKANDNGPPAPSDGSAASCAFVSIGSGS